MAPPFAAPPPPESALHRHRQLAPAANVRVSPICLGTMGFGEAHKQRMGECTKETAFEICDTFVKLGGNFFDSANGYQDGQSEEWLGDWMEARGNREDLVIATKYSSAYQLHHKEKIQSNYGGNGAKSLKHSVELSLKRLKTSYIDVLYLHWWDYGTSIPEVMQSLNDLVRAGKVLYLGISDTPAWVVSKANEYARCHGLRQFALYQGMWNAARRDFERDIIPMCLDEGMAIVPYATLGGGRFQTEKAYQEREKNNPGRKKAASKNERAVSKILEDLSVTKKVQLTSVALAYHLQKAPYVFPLIGCRTVDHLKGNLEGLKIYLSDEEIAKIESAYDFDPGFPQTFLSGSLFGNDGDKQDVPNGPKDVWLTNIMGTFDWVEEKKPIKLGK